MVKYSICMLCSNDGKSLEQSIESLSKLTVSGFEIVVTDNLSKDGSQHKLQDLLKQGFISKVIEQRCTRGRGRQLALESASGDYVLCHMDCDDIFYPGGLEALIRLYHDRHEGVMLMTKKLKGGSSNITISPRELLLRLGGWRDINWMEDWDLWARAAAAGKYVFCPYPGSNPPHKSMRVRWNERNTTLIRKIIARYGKYRDCYRIGRPFFAAGEQIAASQRVIEICAKMTVTIKRSRMVPVTNPLFSEIQE